MLDFMHSSEKYNIVGIRGAFNILEHESDAHDDVWSFFERAGSGEARCAVCRALVPVSALRGHLRDNHPKLVDIVDSDEETTAHNSQEEVYTEVVYLDPEDNPKRKTKSPERQRKFKKATETQRKRKASCSSDEEPLNKIKSDVDEIGQFGKYITCLLRKLPQETSMELQMDIVNMIMRKQLELKRKEASISVGIMPVVTAGEDQTQKVETAAFEIQVADAKSLGNGYSYSIEKIVSDEAVEEKND